MSLDNILLHRQKVAIVVGLMTGQGDEVITEVTVELDTEPVMIGAIVVYKELGGHLGVKKRTEDWIFLALHSGHESSAVGQRHV